MDKVEFIKSLDKDKVYLLGFKEGEVDVQTIEEVIKYLKEYQILAVGMYIRNKDDVQIFEPIGIDKEKLKELIK
jgi:hypothetical protein